MKISKSS